MKYGQGFWVVRNGERLRWIDTLHCFPALHPFFYDDGDLGWFHLEDFTVDYVKPGSTCGLAWRITILGDPNPELHVNSFDFDGASRPDWTKAVTRDKMDKRWIVAADLHDIGYCIHEWRTGFTKEDWDTLLSEVAEAYGETKFQRDKYYSAVALFGGSRYPKTAAELAMYRKLVRIERVPL